MRHIDHRPETVALLGMGPSLVDYMTDGLTQEFTPAFADEIWTINMTSNIYFSDVIFWMDDLEDQQQFKPGLFELMRQREKKGWPYKVMTSKAYPNIVNSYDYPIQEVAQIAIPAFGKPYLNNGVAMAIAYAIWKKVKRLKVYGADFTYPDRDYAESGRACVEAWCTLAERHGMEIMVSPSTSLFDMVASHAVYGYKEPPPITYERDGKTITFTYKEGLGKAGRGIYVAEDTRNELPGSVSRDQGSPAADAGHGPASVEHIAQPPGGPTQGLGEGLRDPDRHGRADAPDHAGDVASGAVRHLSDSGQAPGLSEAGGGGPGRPEPAGPGDLGGDGAPRVPGVPGGKAKAKRRPAKEAR